MTIQDKVDTTTIPTKAYVEEAKFYYEQRRFKHPCLVEVDAKMLADKCQETRGRSLIQDKSKYEAAMLRTMTNAHPMVYLDNNNIIVRDGKHRIAAAATKGQKIDIAVSKTDVHYFTENFKQ